MGKCKKCKAETYLVPGDKPGVKDEKCKKCGHLEKNAYIEAKY